MTQYIFLVEMICILTLEVLKTWNYYLQLGYTWMTQNKHAKS